MASSDTGGTSVLKLTEAIVQFLDVGEDPHGRMVRTVDKCVHAVPARLLYWIET